MSFKEILRFFRALEQGIFAAKPKDNDIDVEAVENEDSIEAVVSHKHTIPVIKHKQAFSLAESIPKSLNIVNKKFEDPVDKEPLARVMEKNSKLHHKHGLSNFEFNTKFIKATEVKITDLDKKAVQHISISLPEEHEFIKGKLNTCVDAIQNFAQELIKQITMPTKPVSINIEFQEEYELINKEKLNNLVNKIQEFSHNLINQMVDNKSEPKIELETQATHNEEYELVDKEKLNTIINEIRKFSHHLIEQMVNTKAETSVLNNKPEPKIELKTQEIYNEEYELVNKDKLNALVNDIQKFSHDLIAQIVNANPQPDHNEPAPLEAEIPVPPPLPPKKVLISVPSVQKSNEKSDAEVIHSKGKAKLELDSVAAEKEDDLRQGQQQRQDDNADEIERNEILRNLMDEIKNFNKDALKKTPVNNEPKAQTPHDALMAQIPAAAKQLKNVADPDSVRAQKIQAIEEGALNRPLNPREELMKAIREHGKINNVQKAEEVYLNDAQLANDLQLPVETNKVEENKNPLINNNFVEQNEPNPATIVIPALPPLPPKKVMAPTIEVKPNNILLDEISLNEKSKSDKPVSVDLLNKNESAEDDLRQGQQEQQEEDAEKKMMFADLLDGIKNFDRNGLKKAPVNTAPKAQTAHDALIAQIPAAAKQLKNVADPDMVRAQKIQAIEEGNPNRPLNAREELMKAIREHGKINNVQKAEEVYLNDA
ncbi:MAG TPA: WH2 domain-containing protein, partial [Gammaproteobacteria bacterium]|nr:WH2 domain-containing protein [Gammaproteobacteria bacterium]